MCVTFPRPGNAIDYVARINVDGSIPLNIHEVLPRPFWGGSSHQNKTPVDHSIGHVPFGSLEGGKRPVKINQNPESLNFLCPKQENNVKNFRVSPLPHKGVSQPIYT